MQNQNVSTGEGWNMLVRYEEIFQFFWASKWLKEMMIICGLIMTFILTRRVRCLDSIGGCHWI